MYKSVTGQEQPSAWQDSLLDEEACSFGHLYIHVYRRWVLKGSQLLAIKGATRAKFHCINSHSKLAYKAYAIKQFKHQLKALAPWLRTILLSTNKQAEISWQRSGWYCPRLNIAPILEKHTTFIGLGKFYFYPPCFSMHNTSAVLQTKPDGTRGCYHQILTTTPNGGVSLG